MAHADRQRQRAQNNWNAFACDVSEHLLLRTSERIVNLGLRDLGYNTVVLDDCWQDPAGRDAKGKVQPDLAKFPRGMKAISDALHAQNLKFGMYSSAGELTCARFAGSLDHEQDDADSFAAWGVDFLKYDNCFHMGRMGTPEISFNRFKAMSDALKASGRDIALNLCNWGEDYVHTWGASLAHAWRMSGDIYDSFTRPDDLCSCASVADPFCVAPGTQCSVLFILNKVAPFADRAIPATSASCRIMDSAALSIINNPAIIALSQDPHGRAVYRVRRDIGPPRVPVADEYAAQEAHIWSGRLANGDQAVIFLNAAGADLDMKASLAEIFVGDGPRGSAPHVRVGWSVHDLWAHRMPLETAEALIGASDDGVRADVLRAANWYNATEIPYAQGLANEDPRLSGEKIGEVQAGGDLEVKVVKHSARVFRLRRIAVEGDGFKSKAHAREDHEEKDEL
ncbi:hypothetical protein VD0001_g710 [Verticillium dahliae]|nr:hypothetical protein VD0001_g710 [Verticillium dahliae]